MDQVGRCCFMLTPKKINQIHTFGLNIQCVHVHNIIICKGRNCLNSTNIDKKNHPFLILVHLPFSFFFEVQKNSLIRI